MEMGYSILVHSALLCVSRTAHHCVYYTMYMYIAGMKNLQDAFVGHFRIGTPVIGQDTTE